MDTFDLVVIGAGPGGYVAAIRAAQEGLKTAIIEGHRMGGECLNYGCIPSKAFIQASHVYEHIAHGSKMGIEVEKASVNLKKLVGWKDGVVKQLTGGVGQLLKANGVTSITGTGSFTGIEGALKKIQIESGLDSYEGTPTGGKSEKKEILAKNVIIATGSTSIDLPFLKADGKFVKNSKHALACEEIPKKLIVLGGGFIGLEIGTFFAKIGSEVTVVEAAPQLLTGTDPDCVAIVHKRLKEKGVHILLNTKATGAQVRGNQAELSIEDEKGLKEKLSADWILLTVGRKPRTANLGLENIGLATSERGFISVNNRLETSIQGVYAIGDVIGGPMLAHKASKEGLTAIECILNPRAQMDSVALPWAIFVDPEIASVGHTVESAKAAGWDPVVGKCPFAANGRALTTGDSTGFVKLVADKKTDRLLGAHMVGPDVSNLVAEVALAIELGATSEDLARTIHAHPTLPETLMEAAESVHGKAVHFFERRKTEKSAPAHA
jgi:dihydrolipoamide dehydrogenase